MGGGVGGWVKAENNELGTAQPQLVCILITLQKQDLRCKASQESTKLIIHSVPKLHIIEIILIQD